MSQPLLSLAPSDLRALAGAIRMARLTAPYSELAIGQIIGSSVSHSVASSLQQLAQTGMEPAGLAGTLELLASALSERPKVEELVEIVATGPKVSGVANRDTAVVVSELFRQAERSVVVAGYAVYQGQKVFQALAARMKERPELAVRMYLDIQRKLGDTSMDSELVKRFCHTFKTTQWPNGSRLPEIYYDPRGVVSDRAKAAALHAKCVVIDGREVFVSSANFTEAAQQRNIEIGLLLRSDHMARRITAFFDSLVEAGELKRCV